MTIKKKKPKPMTQKKAPMRRSPRRRISRTMFAWRRQNFWLECAASALRRMPAKKAIAEADTLLAAASERFGEKLDLKGGVTT